MSQHPLSPSTCRRVSQNMTWKHSTDCISQRCIVYNKRHWRRPQRQRICLQRTCHSTPAHCLWHGNMCRADIVHKHCRRRYRGLRSSMFLLRTVCRRWHLLLNTWLADTFGRYRNLRQSPQKICPPYTLCRKRRQHLSNTCPRHIECTRFQHLQQKTVPSNNRNTPSP